MKSSSSHWTTWYATLKDATRDWPCTSATQSKGRPCSVSHTLKSMMKKLTMRICRSLRTMLRCCHLDSAQLRCTEKKKRLFPHRIVLTTHIEKKKKKPLFKCRFNLQGTDTPRPTWVGEKQGQRQFFKRLRIQMKFKQLKVCAQAPYICTGRLIWDGNGFLRHPEFTKTHRLALGYFNYMAVT